MSISSICALCPLIYSLTKQESKYLLKPIEIKVRGLKRFHYLFIESLTLDVWMSLKTTTYYIHTFIISRKMI